MRRLLLLAVVAGCADPVVRQNAAPSDARAQYEKARLAWEVGDLQGAFDGWTHLLAGKSSDPLWPGIAWLSAYGLEQLTGELAGEKQQAEALARIDDAALPVDARWHLLTARAAYARRAGDETEARRLEKRGGDVERWLVGGPFGTLPRLGLPRAFPPDDGNLAGFREVRARLGEVTLEAPRMRAGVLYAVTFVRAVREEKATLIIDSEQPWRLFIDGKPLYDQIDEQHYLPHLVELDVVLPAGWHRVAIKVAGPGGRADLGFSALADPPLEMSTTPPASLASPPARAERRKLDAGDGTPLGDVIAADEARLVGDGDAAELLARKLMERAPKYPLGQMSAALVALEDDTRPVTLSRDRARRRLMRALALEPRFIRARYLLVTLDLQADRPRDALTRLDAAPKPPGPSWRLSHLRWDALKARGWQREAEEALAESRRVDPEACPPLKDEVVLRRDRHEVARAVELARQASRCNNGGQDLADTLRDRGDLDGALGEYRRLLAVDPLREDWLAGEAATLAQAGRAREAADAFAKLAARFPRRGEYWRERADSLIALGDLAGARRSLEQGLEEEPESSDLHRAHEALCDSAVHCSVMDPFRVDGREIIAAYLSSKERLAYQSPAVIVLDRTVTRVFPTGARLTLTHNIIQVLSKDGIDKWGEVNVPEGADLLTLRTVKADGTTREPEDILEKQAVSVPDLEPGDFVEFEYVDPSAPAGAFPGGFLAERFFFRSYDAPLDRTEFVLATPAGMKIDLDTRGQAPAMALAKKDELEIRTWSGRYQPQIFQEPAAAPFAEFLPSVRAASGLSFAVWRDYLRDDQLGAFRSNLELRELAGQLTKGDKSDRDKLSHLDVWVRRHIKGGGELDRPATHILGEEEGNRVTLLKAMLGALGIASDVALVRPPGAAQLDGDLADLEGFDQALLMTMGESVDPRYRHSATGFVAPMLRGGSWFALAGGPEKRGHVGDKSNDDRHMSFRIELAADGSAEVTVREELRGWPAVQWRDSLDKLAADRVRPEFEQHTLGIYFPGSTLRDIKWSGENDDAGLFTVEYRFHAPRLARKIGERLVLPAPYPATLGRRYIGVAHRTTPLEIEYASPTTLTAEVKTPRGFDAILPQPVQLETPYGRFSQSTKRTADGFRLEAFFAQPQRRVSPGEYPGLVDFSVAVDRAEARAAELVKPAK
jgi:tetratricopeptide (TPR) repeat protein